jgi:hypothetical protein
MPGGRIKKEGRDLGRVKDLTPEVVKLGFDFVTAVKRRDNSTALEILEQIEGFPQFGVINRTWNNLQYYF